MKASLKELADGVRKVWDPPAGRPWSLADVAIMKLLKAIEEHDCAQPRLTKEAAPGTQPVRSREGE